MPFEDPEDLDAALDRLFGAGLGEFVRLRDSLARDFKARGDSAAARALARLRKPPVPAWAVNQLARRDGARLARLLQAGLRMREAQLAAPGGGGAQGLREAAREERQLVAALTERAGELMAEGGHSPTPAHLEAVRLTLSAAAGLPDADRQRLARGRLEQPLVPSGFADLVSFAQPSTAPPPRPSPSPSPEEPPETKRARREREARDRAERARQARDAAARAARRAAARAERLEERARELRAEAEKAAREAADARLEREASAQRLDETSRRLEAAEAELARIRVLH